MRIPTCLLVLVLPAVVSGAAYGDPPHALEGSLLQVHSPGELTDTQIGSFRLESAGPGDLRETPGSAELTLPSGGAIRPGGVANEVRAVDLVTGRPLRRGGAVCSTGAEPRCLPASHCAPMPAGPDPAVECDVAGDVDAFRALDTASAGFFTSFHQRTQTGTPAVTFSTALANLLAGDATGLVFGGLTGVAIPGGPCDPGDVASNILCNPLIPLSNDVWSGGADLDGPPLTFAEAVAAGLTPSVLDGAVLYTAGLQGMLSDEQQALLGCGPYYGTFCDGHGIALVNTEATAFVQSWPVDDPAGWDTTDPSRVQPGTLGFEGSPACERFDGAALALPGCHGLVDVGSDGAPDLLDELLAGVGDDVFEAGYDPARDGTISSAGAIGEAFARAQPFTGQLFQSEMAVLSWNALMTLAALSAPIDRSGDGVPDATLADFDPNDPFRLEGCSLATPTSCANVQTLLAHLTRELDDDPSGPPRRRWVWETGAQHFEAAAFGAGLASFAGWSFHALGPEVSRRFGPASSEEVGVLFVLGPPAGLTTPPDSLLIVRGPGMDGQPGTEDDPFVGLAYGVGGLPAPPAPPPVSFTRIVDTETLVPGEQEPFVFLGGRPSLDRGVVAFAATSPTSPFPASNRIYRAHGGAFHRVADDTTPIPGAQDPFSSFSSLALSLDGLDVAFKGSSSDGSVSGIYAEVGGLLRVVADSNTTPPAENKLDPSISGGDVAFRVEDILNRRLAIYTDAGGPLRVVADSDTPIPGGQGTFGFFGGPSLDEGRVAFSGGSGIYLDDGGTLGVVADLDTTIPGTRETFTSFGTVSLDGDDVAFRGNSSGGTSGIYALVDGTLRTVADTDTPVPGRRETFTSFGTVSLDGGNVAFSSSGGIWAEIDGALVKVIEPSDELDGGVVSDFFGVVIGPEALSGREIAFRAEVEGPAPGMRTGIFVARVPEPGALPLGVFALAAAALLAAPRRRG